MLFTIGFIILFVLILFGFGAIGYVIGKKIGQIEQAAIDEEEFEEYHQEVLDILKAPLDYSKK